MPPIAQFLKAQLSSVLATAADFAVTALLFRLCGLHHTWSTLIGSVTGGVVNCVINYEWTFRTGSRSKSGVALRYIVVWVGSIVLNTCLTTVSVEALRRVIDLKTLMSAKAVMAVLVALLWNFPMQKYFVFRHRRGTQP